MEMMKGPAKLLAKVATREQEMVAKGGANGGEGEDTRSCCSIN
jgi:hypothetical protein